MDNKILVIAAIIGVILLVGVISPREKLPVADRQGEVRGELVDTGRFVLEQAGVPVIEEAYTLFFSPEEGYILLSEATIVVGMRRLTWRSSTSSIAILRLSSTTLEQTRRPDHRSSLPR